MSSIMLLSFDRATLYTNRSSILFLAVSLVLIGYIVIFPIWTSEANAKTTPKKPPGCDQASSTATMKQYAVPPSGPCASKPKGP